MLLQKLPVLQSNSLVLKHYVLSRYKVKVAFFASSSSILFKSIENRAHFVIIWIKELSGWIRLIDTLDSPFLHHAQPSMMNRHALEEHLKFYLLFVEQTLRCLQILL